MRSNIEGKSNLEPRWSCPECGRDVGQCNGYLIEDEGRINIRYFSCPDDNNAEIDMDYLQEQVEQENQARKKLGQTTLDVSSVCNQFLAQHHLKLEKSK